MRLHVLVSFSTVVSLSILSLVWEPAFAMDTRPIKRAPAAQESLPPQPEQTDGTVPVEVTEPGPTASRVAPPSAEETLAAATAPQPTPWVITGNYSYLDLWVPSKIGFTVGYRATANSFIEFDYMRGGLNTKWIGINLGDVSEQRAAIVWRRFSSGAGSFNYFIGANYNDLELTVGDSALATVTASSPSEVELIRLSTLGVSAGLGNRWVFESGFTLGVDWVHLHLPLLTLVENAPFRDATSDPDRRSEADDLIRFVKNFPRFAALKLQLGISF